MERETSLMIARWFLIGIAGYKLFYKNDISGAIWAISCAVLCI